MMSVSAHKNESSDRLARSTRHAVVQPKMEIGQPGDKYEREADAVADKVVMMPNTSDSPLQMKSTMGGSDISMKCAECEKEEKLQMKPLVQRSTNGGKLLASDRLSQKLSGTKGQGSALPSQVSYEMSSKIGADFSGVKVHTNSTAIQMNQALGARAFAHGSDLYFNSGKFNPSSSTGKHLLAHELTHVVQQGHANASASSTSGMSHHTTNTPLIQRSAIYTGRVLAHGSCYHLACNSRWALEDERHGYECGSGTRNEGRKMRPLFTCDRNEEGAHASPCRGDQMAIPHSRWRGFEGGQCGQDLVICANGRATHGTVRDRSSGEHWEVGTSILRNLGIQGGDISNGAIYPDERDGGFRRDSRCR